MEIFRTIDGFIVATDGARTYCESLADFNADAPHLCAALPALPPDRVAWAFNVGARIMVFYDAKQNAFPLPGETEWAGGGQIAAALDAMMAARDTRKANARAASDELTQAEIDAARATEQAATDAYMAEVKATADAANAKARADFEAAEAALQASHAATRAQPPQQPPAPRPDPLPPGAV